MTWPQLQAYVDEVAAKFGDKNWQVLPVSELNSGQSYAIAPTCVRFVESALDTVDQKALRFDLAAKIGETIVIRHAQKRGIAWSSFIFAGLLVTLLLLTRGAGEELPISSPIGEIMAFGFVVLIYLGFLAWALRWLRSAAFLGNLLFLTEDPVRTRDYLVSENATPRELAKFDELVRQMGLEAPKPA